MGNFLYVDNSNIYIEGMRVAAVAKGDVPDIYVAAQNRVGDPTWKLDFGKLFQFAGGTQQQVKKATLFGSTPPTTDSLWKAAQHAGFEVITYERNLHSNKEKKIDTDIVATMMEDSYEKVQAGDEMTLVSGDRDYVPALEKLKKRGIPVHVVFWNHAAKELKEVATSFIDLNPYIDHLRR